MAVPNQFMRPPNQAPQWMPQGNQGQANMLGGQNAPRYSNQLGAYTQPSLQPYKQPSALSRFFLGSPEHFQQTPKYGPQGLDLLSQLQSMGLQNQQNPYAGFEPIEQEATRNFNTQYVPGLIEQFTAGYNNNDRGSSALTGALGAAGSGLQSMLAAQKAQYGQQNKQFGLNQAQLGLTEGFDTIPRERQPGYIENVWENANKAAQIALKAYLGGL